MQTLIRLGGCPGWSESSLCAQATLLVLSWGGSSGEVSYTDDSTRVDSYDKCFIEFNIKFTEQNRTKVYLSNKYADGTVKNETYINLQIHSEYDRYQL